MGRRGKGKRRNDSEKGKENGCPHKSLFEEKGITEDAPIGKGHTHLQFEKTKSKCLYNI